MMMNSDLPKEMLPAYIQMVKGIINDEAMIKGAVNQGLEVFDRNEDGFLQWEEFCDCIENFYSQMKLPIPSKGKIALWFQKADLNADRKISKEEFEPVVIKMLKITLAELEKMLAL